MSNQRLGYVLSILGVWGVCAGACGGSGQPETGAGTAGGAGGSASSGGSGATSAGGAGGTGGDAGPAPLPPITPTGTFVVNRWFIGDTDTNWVSDSDAWKSFGLNLDGLASAGTSQDHCATVGVTVDPGKVREDGLDGIDNVFGHLIVPYMHPVLPHASHEVSAAVKGGAPTLLVRTNLLELPPNATTVGVRLYFTAPVAAPPAFDGTDVFPIDSAWLTNGSLSADDAIAIDLQANIAGNRLTITLADDAVLPLRFRPQDYELNITAHHVRLVLELDPTRAYVIRGTLAGVFLAEEAIAETKRMLGNFDPGICHWTQLDPQTPDNLMDFFRGTQDILAEGTNHSGVSCSAISFGMGFQATAATLGAVDDVPQPPTEPCPAP